MLSMSSDTLESTGSKEMTAIDYGQSRSSTPDSSASSRLAAQLERSAYRRSRSNIRRRQHSNNSNGYLDSGRKSSKNKRLKNQQRNQLYVQEDTTKTNGWFEGSQKSSGRRTFIPDDDHTEYRNKPEMAHSETTVELYPKERFNESEDRTKILTAHPVAAYTVNCLTAKEDERSQAQPYLNYITEDFSRQNNTRDSLSRGYKSHGELHNYIAEDSSRTNTSNSLSRGYRSQGELQNNLFEESPRKNETDELRREYQPRGELQGYISEDFSRKNDTDALRHGYHSRVELLNGSPENFPEKNYTSDASSQGYRSAVEMQNYISEDSSRQNDTSDALRCGYQSRGELQGHTSEDSPRKNVANSSRYGYHSREELQNGSAENSPIKNYAFDASTRGYRSGLKMQNYVSEDSSQKNVRVDASGHGYHSRAELQDCTSEDSPRKNGAYFLRREHYSPGEFQNGSAENCPKNNYASDAPSRGYRPGIEMENYISDDFSRKNETSDASGHGYHSRGELQGYIPEDSPKKNGTDASRRGYYSHGGFQNGSAENSPKKNDTFSREYRSRGEMQNYISEDSALKHDTSDALKHGYRSRDELQNNSADDFPRKIDTSNASSRKYHSHVELQNCLSEEYPKTNNNTSDMFNREFQARKEVHISRDFPRKNDTPDPSRHANQSHGNGMSPNKQSGERIDDCQNETKNNGVVGLSRVKFEESWDDPTTREIVCKGREESTTTHISTRSSVNPNTGLKDWTGSNNTMHPGTHFANDENGQESTVASPEDEGGNRNAHNEDVTYRRKNASIKRKVNKQSVSGPAQIVPEIGRVDESKSLGLRQLIKIHEVQIAEVAKSAAAMKRTCGKFQEGRLVKVKVVPETKQTHGKVLATKPSDIRNEEKSTNFEDRGGIKILSQDKPGKRVDKSSPAVPGKVTGEYEFDSSSSGPGSPSRTTVKQKRHTVELRKTKPLVQEEQKRKRHTTIGLVGFDQDTQLPYATNGWSPAEGNFRDVLANDSDHEADYLRKQIVEPEKQVIDEEIKRMDVVDIKTITSNKVNEVLISSDGYKQTENDDEENEVPPERPPLPEHFYSSTEDFLERPPSPAVKDVHMLTQVMPENVTLKNKITKPLKLNKLQYNMPLSSSLPALHVSSAVELITRDGFIQAGNIREEKDTVLGNSRTTREMYEERLARINLVPFDSHERIRTDQNVVSSQGTSLESFACETNLYLDKAACLDTLKTSLKQVKLLRKEKEDLEKNFELQLRDWKRKYEEQQKVANAYQKLEDRYRRRVEELQAAVMQCRCSDIEARKSLLIGQPGKRSEPYFLSTQTQSILDETEEWLKEQSVRSEVTHNSENVSNNARMTNGTSPRASLSDVTVGTEWATKFKDFELVTNIDQYNGTSV